MQKMEQTFNLSEENVKFWTENPPLDKSDITSKISKFLNLIAENKDDRISNMEKLYTFLNSQSHYLTYYDKFRKMTMNKIKNEILEDTNKDMETLREICSKTLDIIEKIEHLKYGVKMSSLFSAPVEYRDYMPVWDVCCRPIFQRQPNLEIALNKYELPAYITRDDEFSWGCIEFQNPIQIPYVKKTYQILAHCYKSSKLSEYSSESDFTPEWYAKKSLRLDLYTPFDPEATLFLSIQWHHNTINVRFKDDNDVHSWVIRNLFNAWDSPEQKLNSELKLLKKILNDSSEEMKPKINNRIAFIEKELQLTDIKDFRFD